MNLQLSWDLFILAFFGVVIAYSFIIGRNQTLKVISATYIGILCSDAIGNLFSAYLADSAPFLQMVRLFSISSGDQATAFFKVIVLIIFIVVIAVRGVYLFDSSVQGPFGLRMAINFILGVVSAALMMSAIMVFITGGSFVVASTSAPIGPLQAIYGDSRLVRMMVDYSNFWFLVPGVALVALSVLDKKSS